MFNKTNTKQLVIAFVVLLALVLIGVPLSNKKKSHSFNSDITAFDTAFVKSFTIYPKAGGDLITFTRKENNWFVADKSGEFNADNKGVENMLVTLSHIKAKKLVANKKDSWKKYEVTDSLGTRVKVTGDKKALADIVVGKFSYTQAKQPSNNPYQRQQGTMTSFVRLTKDKEVYGVDGYLSMNFNRSIKDFRDNEIIQLKKENISSISMTGPKGSYTLSNSDSLWLADGIEADSAATEKYISGLKHVRSTNFILDKNKPVGTPNYSLKIVGKNGKEKTTIEAYYNDSTNVIITSSLNPGTYFEGNKSGLFKKLFKDKSVFLAPK